MNQPTTAVLARERADIKILVFCALLGAAAAAPAISHWQWVSGPIVNATLFLAAALLGPAPAIMIGLIPSAMALASGLLPLPLAPMLPFIMIANAVLIIAFGYFKNWSFALAVLIASALKFVFLYSIVTLLMNTLLPGPLVQQLSIMMSWPQLYTALIGGAIAFAILKSLKKV